MDARGVPSGTVTFLFTDVVGSTTLWEREPAAMASSMERHDALLRGLAEEHGCYVFTTAGDSFAIACDRAETAAEVAVEIQRRLGEQRWQSGGELAVRIGLHTGEAVERDGDYFGSVVNRAARLMSAAHGGQIVVSSATHDVLRDAGSEFEFVDLGLHRLKDLSAAERIFQIAGSRVEEVFDPLRTLDIATHNLPVARDELIGRSTEILQIREMVRHGSLVTVTGVGGIGKTRLTLQAAAEMVEQFDDGVWWCELAPVGDPGAMANAVAQALGVRQHPGRSMVDSVAEYCRWRQLLIVLDNCEHLLDAAAELTDRLLSVAPNVTILASSREAMEIAGEQTFSLRPLDATDSTSPAVELLLQRASAAGSARDYDVGETEAAKRICERLDGLPLAIELTASRARSLSLAEIEARLGDAFRWSRGSQRGADRHRTLEATIAWSYEPLDDVTQLLFERLSVFAGGFDLRAAEEVCPDDVVEAAQVFDLIDGLVAKSLVVVDTMETTSRYRLLEPLRQYAQARHVDRDDCDHSHDRHLDYFTRRAEDWYENLWFDEQRWVREARTEWANLRAAVEWATATGDVDRAARLVRSTVSALYVLIEHEAGTWAQRVLELDGIDEHPLGPELAGIAGTSLWWLGDLDLMARYVDRGERMAAYRIHLPSPTSGRALLLRTSGDYEGFLRLLAGIEPTTRFGRVSHWFLLGIEHTTQSAYTDLSAAEDFVVRLGEEAAETGSNIARRAALHIQAGIELVRGNPRQAAELCREAIVAARTVGFLWGAHIVAGHLGWCAAVADDLRTGDLRYFEQTLREQVDAGQRNDLWFTLGALFLPLRQAGQRQLAADIADGLQTSTWAKHPAFAELAAAAADSAVPSVSSELDDLVDRTLKVLESDLGELTEL